MADWLRGLFRFLAGVCLLPVVIAVSQVFYRQLDNVQGLSGNQAYFFIGAGVYILIHLTLYKPVYLYVLGHELAHAITTFICGGRVHSLRVSSKGGRVSTTKSNFFINLAPYFFPMYTMLFSLIFFVLSLFRNMHYFVPYFVFIVGFTLAFHLVLTIDSLRMRQTDILKTGYLFSVSLIYIANITILTLILSALFPKLSFMAFIRASAGLSKQLYIAILNWLA